MTRTRSSSSSTVDVSSRRLRNGTRRAQSGRISPTCTKEKTVKKQRPRAKSLQETRKNKMQVSMSELCRPENGCDAVLDNHNVISSTSLNEDLQDDDTDSLDDNDLPAIQYHSSTAATKVKELVPGTMVWAKSRGFPHWPAVLQKVFSNNKKAWVNYLDKTYQRVQVSLKSMAPFFGPSRSQYIEIGKSSKFSQEFLESMKMAEDYLIKQGLGKSAESSNQSFSLDFGKSASPTASPRKMPLSRQTSPDRSHDTESSADLPTSTNNDVSTDEEICIGHPIGSTCYDAVDKDDPALIERRKAWKCMENRLLKYIHRDTTKNHLLDIYHGKYKCERQRLFKSDRQADRLALRTMAGQGPITDEELLSELTNFLRDLYVENCMECKEDIPNASYITEVWLPEAIIFAIQKTRRVVRHTAEELFHSEGVQSLIDLGDDMPAASSTVSTSWDKALPSSTNNNRFL
ncbi:PWWP domain-containing protein MUM1-like [Acanthaster planci]|uniref:PWWP domain-containing protein MUM1-like n=1 Tax=Acanthaster planci TaxID=133434 RepID=A0A8B7ZDQ9_ACAPL|nr:PWWP domain-containing protein MUM1-like [Acanthaster planci]XP_022102971.1 PWWP domain-containing protein MUM1-like [Acanthaster planci]